MCRLGITFLCIKSMHMDEYLCEYILYARRDFIVSLDVLFVDIQVKECTIVKENDCEFETRC